VSVCTAVKEEKHKEVKNIAIAVHFLYLHGRLRVNVYNKHKSTVRDFCLH